MIDPVLVYSTYLGGSGEERGLGIAVDGAGNAYVTGYTGSTDFPATPGAYDTTYNGGYDGFVAKLDGSGTALVYATYLGGSGGDSGYGIAVDVSGNAYVTGYTDSADFPRPPGRMIRHKMALLMCLWRRLVSSSLPNSPAPARRPVTTRPGL